MIGSRPLVRTYFRLSKKPVIARPIPLVKGKCPEGTKGIGRPNGPTWQSVSKTHEYQHISDFWVADSHVASLLGMASLYFMRDRISGLEIFLLFLKKPLYKPEPICYYQNTNKSYY